MSRFVSQSVAWFMGVTRLSILYGLLTQKGIKSDIVMNVPSAGVTVCQLSAEKMSAVVRIV